MILGTAAILEALRHRPPWPLALAGMLALVVLLYSNANTAFKALASIGEAASEAKQAKINSASQLDSQARTILARREVQVKLAGESTVGALEAQLQQLTMSEVRLWNATSQCEDVSAKASGAFCARVADARAKIEAAKARDKIDEELASLRKESKAAGAVPTTADAYSENVASLLSVILGREMTAADKRVIRAHYEVVRAIGLELMAAVGPAFHLLLVDVLQGGAAGVVAAVAARRRRPTPAVKPEPASVNLRERDDAPAPADPADEYDRCIADVFETDPAGAMLAREIRPLVKVWFDKQGLGKVNEKALWARMRNHFKHDGNNGRPKYYGLKPRPKAGIRLAISNE
jgi:hypothetical protein